MIKKFFISCLLSLFIVCAPFNSANAAFGIKINFPAFNFHSLTSIYTLKSSVVFMAKKINAASSRMMKFGDMLICNAEHGENSYHTFSIIGFSFSVHWTDFFTWTAGWILLILGFFIMMLASFYIFDIAFNLGVSMFLLPICLSLWPFAWTRENLKTNIEGIVYYVGIFIFLPLGILIAVRITEVTFQNVLQTSTSANYQLTFEQAFAQDQSDFIRDHLGVDSLDFWKIFFCYIVALRVIPLMATEFCTHFFSSSAVGNPMSDKLAQGIDILKRGTVDRAINYGSDVFKHGYGTVFKRGLGNEHGNMFQRWAYRYGTRAGKTKKKKKK